jgi:excinuclease ABC subunit C
MSKKVADHQVTRRATVTALNISAGCSAWSARHTRLHKKVFPLVCNKQLSGSETRPCLKYHIRRCRLHRSYKQRRNYQVVRQVVAVLETEELIHVTEKAMEQPRIHLNLKKQPLPKPGTGYQAVIASNNIPLNIRGEQDAIALARDDDLACVRIFSVRDTRLTGDQYFIMDDVRDECDARLLEGFLKQYYSSADHIPGCPLATGIGEPLLITNGLKVKGAQTLNCVCPSKGPAFASPAW